MRRFGSIICLLALGACTTPLPLPDQPATPRLGTVAAESVQGQNRMTLRTTLGNREVAGADCEIIGQGFRIEARTPSVIAMPDFGPQTQPAVLRCTLNGKTRTIRLTPYNRSSEMNRDLIQSRNEYGVAIGVLTEVARDKSRDRMGYRDITLPMD